MTNPFTEARTRQERLDEGSAAAAVTVVVPVFNSMRYLPQTVPALVRAAELSGNVELIFVDNGSTDGSEVYLEQVAYPRRSVHHRPGAHIGALRNFGASIGSGTYISFLDADCGIAPDYFQKAIEVLVTTGASATGCEVRAPNPPHWIEGTWHDLHYIGRERDVHYLNSANFFITREAFEAVGGFNEALSTGEDAEIGQRLVEAGYRIRESSRVDAVHYGNPKSLRAFYRRTVWHGLGMFGTVTRRRIDKPTAMMAAHFGLTLLGLAALTGARLSLISRLGLLILSQLAVPLITVFHRQNQTGRHRRWLSGVGLYWLYYWARIQAFFLILLGRERRYRK